MTSLSRRLRRSLLLSTASALALTQLVLPMSAANAAGVTRVQGAAGWLATQFADATHLPAPDGDHFDSKFGSTYFPNYGENADAVFGLAAAKVGASKAKVALEYLDAHLVDYADTSGTFGGPFDGSIAKLALARIVAGESADDLLAMLQDHECTGSPCTPGAPANIFNSASDSFVMLAEARAGGSFAPSAAAVDYFVSLQCANGGFTDSTDACGSGAAAVDATSYGIMALQALGGHSAELTKAADWLASQRNAAGYWISQGVPNTNSTGLAAAALSGAGRDVSTSRAWLFDQQVDAGVPGTGALKYAGKFTPSTTSATSPSVLATAQGLMGLVKGSSLATLTASGSTGNANLLSSVAVPSTRLPAPGSSVTLHGVGYAAGERVIAELENAVVTRIGDGVADPSGVVDFTATLPDNAAPGVARLVVRGAASGATVSLRIRVLASGASGTPTPSTPPLANTGADSSELLTLGLAALIAGLGLMTVTRQRRRGRHAA